MKNKTKFILLTTLLSIIGITLFIAIINTLPMSYSEFTQSAKKMQSGYHDYLIEVVTQGPLVDGQCVGKYLEITAATNRDTAIKAGYVFYCMEHGQGFIEGNTYTPIAKLFKYGSIENGGGEAEGKVWLPAVCPAHNPKPDEGVESWPQLRCAGHTDYASNSGDYNPGIGYAITVPGKDWSEPKQIAVWALLGQYSQTNNIYYEALKYKEFHDKTTDGGAHPEEPDLKIKDETDVNKITVKANNKQQTLTVGPFSIDYIYGYYEEVGVAFGGISDMYMIGYNSKDQIVKERIEINKYIDPDGKGHELKKEDYFQPEQETLIDTTKQVYPKGISGGEETFQVQIDNPNSGLAGDADEDLYVAKVKLHIEFKWMGVTNAYVCKTNAFRYQVTWKCIDHPKHCHHSHNSGCYTPIINTDKNGNSYVAGYTLTCKHVCTEFACNDCIAKSWLEPKKVQGHFSVISAQRKLFKAELEIDVDDKGFPLTMDLGGKVWEDKVQGKESKWDGKYTESDRVIPNVKVTLFTEDGKVATLLSNAQEGKNDADVMSRVNPTYTDEKGDYLFKGIDPMKKYYVQFEYNGQVYLPTDYNLNISDYNKKPWEITSKGTETTSDRDTYDKTTFAEIGSAPVNYKVPSDSMKIAKLTNGYNESFSQYDLMGFELQENGDYAQKTRLIDSFFKIKGGNIVETDEIQEGEISKEIKAFILEKKKSPTDDELKEIYKTIAGRDEEKERKLQFIEDTYMQSYTQAQGAAKKDLYPIYDEFIINKTIDMEYDNAEQARKLSYDLKEETLDGITYKPIYPGQFYINQGLWRRQEVDIALKKDALYAATKINGKTEVYEYNKRADYTDAQREELRQLRIKYEKNGRKPEDYQAYLTRKSEIESTLPDYWQIQVRMREYLDYYNNIYTKELYPADYAYRNTANNYSGSENKNGRDLELYITYKLTIRNVSQSILGEITEVVDYFDRDYKYRDDLSWVMFKGKNDNDNLDQISFTEDDYYNTIHKESLSGNIKTYGKDTKADEGNSKYEKRSPECISDMTKEFDDVYIKGLQGKKLESGEEAYIYLTFQVKNDYTTGISKYATSEGNVVNGIRLDKGDDKKYNYAEINGYKTYYKNGTSLPNGIKKGEKDSAGLVDINSTPGNLCRDDIEPRNSKYEHNFENDTDRAKYLKVTLEDGFIRSINGTSWEDQRTKTVDNAIIGDGVYNKNGEIGINGVTVELVEKLENGGEFVWQTTQTGSCKGWKVDLYTGQLVEYRYIDENDNEMNSCERGYYQFASMITGNYIVRFHYGDTYETVLTNKNKIGNVTGLNVNSYNGQDFKSTVYQKNMNGKDFGDKDKYDISGLDDYKDRLSDAKDLSKQESQQLANNRKGIQNIQAANGKIISPYIGRSNVIAYSNKEVTNNLAEILASPYANTMNKNDIDTLIKNTNMTAETNLIVFEGEYNRTGSDGYSNVSNGNHKFGNDTNGNYTLNNVDFGLTERPKAQLELTKKITNVKVTLANGNVLFDAVKSQQDLKWQPGEAYKIDSKMSNKKYNEYYNNNHRYYYRGTIDDIVNGKYSSGTNGFIDITMDEEIMHGATIRVSYDLTVTNVGEADYNGEKFYYKGTDTSDPVTTRADVVLDYVSNNLQFREVDNGNGWKAVQDIAKETGINGNNRYQNEDKDKDFNTHVAQYNTLIKTGSLNKDLVPTKVNGTDSKTTVGLILTQLITPENAADDKTYTNIAEITTISNDVGRRMAYSIQGNQDPTVDPKEVDSFRAERITILPPFGSGNVIVYIAVALGVLTILTVGIIFIKKKVLKG